MTDLRRLLDSYHTTGSDGCVQWKGLGWSDLTLAESAIRADEAAKSEAEIERLRGDLIEARRISDCILREKVTLAGNYLALLERADALRDAALAYMVPAGSNSDDVRRNLKEALNSYDAAAPTPEPGPELNNDEEELDEGWDRIAEAIVKFAPAPTDDEASDAWLERMTPEPEEVSKAPIVKDCVRSAADNWSVSVPTPESVKACDGCPPDFCRFGGIRCEESVARTVQVDDDPLAGIPKAESIADCVRAAVNGWKAPTDDEPINEFAVQRRLDDHERRLDDHWKRMDDLSRRISGVSFRLAEHQEAAPARPVVTVSDEMVDAGRAFWEKTFEEVISTRHMWKLLEAALAASGENSK